jgi:S1-C subfamily serine protease
MLALPATAQVDPGGKRLAIVVKQACETNPSAASFLLDQDEDDCSADVLESVRKKIMSVLSSKGTVTSAGDADLVLTVTMTKRRVDTGVGGLIGDFTAAAITSANYTLANSAGNTLTSGTVNDQDDDEGDDEDALELKFATKLAGEVAAKLPSGPTATAAPPPRFGVGVTDLAPSVAEGLGHPGLTGAQVIQCLGGSLADKAGIKLGDIIYEFDGTAVANAKALVAAVAAAPAGKAVSVKLLRGKQDLVVQVQF